MQDQVDQRMGKRRPAYPSVQENAQAHADRASLPCGAVAERIPGKVRSVQDTIPTQNCLQAQAGFFEALQVTIRDVLQGL